jgi:hypothetical protein
MRRAASLVLAANLGLVVAVAASDARASELDVALGLDAGASSWDSDGAGNATFKLGYRFWRPWFQINYRGKLGYGSVDERMLTYLSLGVEIRPQIGRLRPYVYSGLVHQHEEPVVAVEHQPFQSLLGVGDGIRHRGGGNLGVGLEVPVYRHQNGDFYVAFDLGSTYFPDDRGPNWYFAGGVALGSTWDFSRTGAADAAAR